MAIIEKVKNFYKTKRILFFVVIFVWLILTILSGILIGLYSNSKVIYLSPEEENASHSQYGRRRRENY